MDNNTELEQSPNWELVQVDDFVFDDEGNIATVCNVAFSSLGAKQLRTIASRLKIRGVRNVKKEEIAAAIKQTVTNMKAYDELDTTPKDKPRKEA